MKWTIYVDSVVSGEGITAERVSGSVCDVIDDVSGLSVTWDYASVDRKPHALYLPTFPHLPKYVRSSIVSAARAFLAAQKKGVTIVDRRTTA